MERIRIATIYYCTSFNLSLAGVRNMEIEKSTQLMSNGIRQLRKERNLTLLELSKQLQNKENLKLSPDAIAKYERGDREPKLGTWQKLSDYFGVPADYMLGISQYRTIEELIISHEGSDLMLDNRLRIYMAQDRVGTLELAKATGLSRHTITSFTMGNPRMIQVKTMEKLCDYFEITPNDLFGWDERSRNDNT